LNGSSPKNLAPHLFQKSRRKNISVQKALHGNHWIDLVRPLTTGVEIREYAELWEVIQLQARDTNADDEITWRWTPNGEYTTKSAYRIQFIGRTKTSLFHPIWKAKTEPKCRFFAWLLLQKKSWQQTIWRKGAGHKTRYASYVIVNQKRRHTYAKIAVSRERAGIDS